MRHILALISILTLAACAGAATVTPTAPDRRVETRVSSAKEAAFQSWVRAYKARAVARGIPEPVLERAFADVRYNAEVIEKDRNQAEFSLPIWDYLARLVSDEQVSKGRAALRQNRAVLAQIEERYGVDAEVIVAVWGAETRYGETRGTIPVVEATATLAFDGRRGAFFERQLDEALRILARGDTSPANMTGSWAGAMGHTQFIPTSFAEYAVDFDGDGRRDIWSDDPTDALASTAAYLARFGWRRGQPVAVEVRLSDGADPSLARRSFTLSPSQWPRAVSPGSMAGPYPTSGKPRSLCRQDPQARLS
ncbi:MAG: lytic murein transglycosylase [Pseudomonadota bacterium]